MAVILGISLLGLLVPESFCWRRIGILRQRVIEALQEDFHGTFA